MFVLGNLFIALAQLLQTVFTLYTWVIIARVLVSWVNPDPFNPIVRFLMRMADPYLDLFRRVIPPIGFLDISPIIALLVLSAFSHFAVQSLMDLGMRLR
jgi:YggT family protein